MKKITITLFSLLITLSALFAQENVLSGIIFDAGDKNPIPFAHVSVAGEITGTIANENGEFEIHFPPNTGFITFSSIGYMEKNVEVKKEEETGVKVYLELWVNEISEAVVMPKSARDYVNEALKKHEQNITSSPFNTQAYFSSSNIMENGEAKNIKKTEAVFKTYYPNYADTSFHNQNQLVLHRFSDNEVEVDLSMIQNKKVEKKMNKLNEKQAKRDEKNGVTPDEDDEGATSSPFASGEGPEFVLSTFQNIKGLNFFSEMFMDQIDFTIGNPSYDQSRELITINFKNEKPIYLMFRYNGTIYLDSESLAIVSIEYTENMKIPGLLRPIVKKKTGINILGFENRVFIQNQLNQDLWYPKKIIYKSKINLKEGKAFKANEHLYLSSQHILSVESVNVNSAKPISKDVLYDKSKPYEEQVFPLENLNWENVNVVN